MGLLIPPVPTDIKLFSREWCSWCIDAKDYLAQRGYQFTEIDVGLDRAAYEEMKALSETYVPTLVAGDEVLANFDTDQLRNFCTSTTSSYSFLETFRPNLRIQPSSPAMKCSRISIRSSSRNFCTQHDIVP